ncbi:hypothetical protein CVT25_000027, partial [Psilocybe cyanescens]
MAHKSPVNAAKKLLEKANKSVKHSWDRITGPKSRNASPSTSNRGSIDSVPGAHNPSVGNDGGSTEVTNLGSSNDPLNQNLADSAHRSDPTPYASKSVSAEGPTVSLPPLDSNAASHQGSPYISPLSPSGIVKDMNTLEERGLYTSQHDRPLDNMSSVAAVGDDREGSLGRSLTVPDALSADYQLQDSNSKSTTKDVLELAWTGMKMLLKKVEGCLDGTLARPPVASINAFIDIKK